MFVFLIRSRLFIFAFVVLASGDRSKKVFLRPVTKSILPMFSSRSFFFFLTLFYFTVLYWFCHALTWIHHGCIQAPNPESPSHLAPHIISLDHLHAPAPSILYPISNIDWQFVSYMIVYMFQCHSPKSSHLSLSHRVQKSVLYICVSFAVSYTGLVQLSHPYMTSGKTMALTRWTFVGKVMSLLFNMK